MRYLGKHANLRASCEIENLFLLNARNIALNLKVVYVFVGKLSKLWKK